MKFISFERILFVSSMLLAVCGAYYSIVGISTLFSGAMISVGIMAGIIEFSKLCSVTFLYRYWNNINKLIKIYMTIASIILMFITSFGIAGFLLSAYQASSIELKSTKDKISIIENKKIYFLDMIESSKSRIKTLNDMRNIQESRLSETLTNAFLTRNPIQLKQIQDQTIDMVKTADENIKIEQSKIENNSTAIQKINEDINNISFTSANKKDVRTFQFLAEQFGTTMDIIAKWFILVIICVFDPLAISLIIAYNVITHKKEEPKHDILSSNNNMSKSDINLQSSTDIITPDSSITTPPESISVPTDGLNSFYRRMFKL